MQPQAHWAVALRCICPAAQLVSIFASPQRSPASINTNAVLSDQKLVRFVPATAAHTLPLCVAFAMATLDTVRSRDSHATREEILQHLYNDEFFALIATNRWLYYHPDIVATKIVVDSAVVERLVHLINRLRSVPRVYKY